MVVDCCSQMKIVFIVVFMIPSWRPRRGRPHPLGRLQRTSSALGSCWRQARAPGQRLGEGGESIWVFVYLSIWEFRIWGFEDLSIWVFKYLSVWVFEAGWRWEHLIQSLDPDFTRCTSTSTTSRGTWATRTTWRRAARAPGLRRWSTARTAGTGPGRWEKPHQPDLSSQVPEKSFRITFSGGGAVSRRPGLRGGPWDRSSPWHRPLAKQVVSYVSKGTVFRGQQNPAAIFWNLLRIIFLCLMTCCPADVGHSPSGGASQWRYWIGARGFPKLLWASILLYS